MLHTRKLIITLFGAAMVWASGLQASAQAADGASASAPVVKAEEKSRGSALLSFEGEGVLQRSLPLEQGTTRLWLRRVSGPGAIQDRAIPFLALRLKDKVSREYRVVGNDLATSGAPGGEMVTVAVDHGNRWSSSKVLVTWERKGAARPSSDEGNPMWVELALDHGVAVSSRSVSPGYGGVNVRVFKDMGDDKVVFAGAGHDWDWQSPSWYASRPLEGQANRGELGIGTRPPVGDSLLGAIGVDLGSTGLGSSRPLTLTGEWSRTLIPGDTEWRASAKLDGHVGTGWTLGAQLGGDVLLVHMGDLEVLGGAEIVVVAADGDIMSASAGPRLSGKLHLDEGWTAELGMGARLGRDKDGSVLVPSGAVSLTRRY